MDRSKRSEHVQRGKPKPAADAPADVTAARPDLPAAGGVGTPGPQDPGMSQKYWIAILLWAVAFVVMILYEIIAAIWRR